MSEAEKPFVVFGTIRSGSYNLVSLLNSAEDLVCYGEIYKGNSVELPEEELGLLGLGAGDLAKRDAMGAGLLEKIRSANLPRQTGFKLFPAHLSGRAFLEEALFSGAYRVVILSRAMLEICVSHVAAEQGGSFVRREGEPLVEQKVEIGLGDLQNTIGYVRRHRKLSRMLRQDPKVETFDINYRQTKRKPALGRLLAFLGSAASAEALASGYVPQSRSALHERVVNWAEMVEHLTALDRLDLLKEAGYEADGSPS